MFYSYTEEDIFEYPTTTETIKGFFDRDIFKKKQRLDISDLRNQKEPILKRAKDLWKSGQIDTDLMDYGYDNIFYKPDIKITQQGKPIKQIILDLNKDGKLDLKDYGVGHTFTDSPYDFENKGEVHVPYLTPAYRKVIKEQGDLNDLSFGEDISYKGFPDEINKGNLYKQISEFNKNEFSNRIIDRNNSQIPGLWHTSDYKPYLLGVIDNRGNLDLENQKAREQIKPIFDAISNRTRQIVNSYAGQLDEYDKLDSAYLEAKNNLNKEIGYKYRWTKKYLQENPDKTKEDANNRWETILKNEMKKVWAKKVSYQEDITKSHLDKARMVYDQSKYNSIMSSVDADELYNYYNQRTNDMIENAGYVIGTFGNPLVGAMMVGYANTSDYEAQGLDEGLTDNEILKKTIRNFLWEAGKGYAFSKMFKVGKPVADKTASTIGKIISKKYGDDIASKLIQYGSNFLITQYLQQPAGRGQQIYRELKEGNIRSSIPIAGAMLGDIGGYYWDDKIDKVFTIVPGLRDTRLLPATSGDKIPYYDRHVNVKDVLFPKTNTMETITTRFKIFNNPDTNNPFTWPQAKEMGWKLDDFTRHQRFDKNIDHGKLWDYTHGIPFQWASYKVGDVYPYGKLFTTSEKKMPWNIANVQLTKSSLPKIDVNLRNEIFRQYKELDKVDEPTIKKYYEEVKRIAEDTGQPQVAISPKRLRGFKQSEHEVIIIKPDGFKFKKKFAGITPDGDVIFRETPTFKNIAENFKFYSDSDENRVMKYFEILGKTKEEYLRGDWRPPGEYGKHGIQHFLHTSKPNDIVGKYYGYHDITKVGDKDVFKKYEHGRMASELLKRGLFPNKQIYKDLTPEQIKQLAKAFEGHTHARFTLDTVRSPKEFKWWLGEKIKKNPYLEEIATLDRIDLKRRYGLDVNLHYLSEDALQSLGFKPLDDSLRPADIKALIRKVGMSKIMVSKEGKFYFTNEFGNKVLKYDKKAGMDEYAERLKKEKPTEDEYEYNVVKKIKDLMGDEIDQTYPQGKDYFKMIEQKPKEVEKITQEQQKVIDDVIQRNKEIEEGNLDWLFIENQKQFDLEKIENAKTEAERIKAQKEYDIKVKAQKVWEDFIKMNKKGQAFLSNNLRHRSHLRVKNDDITKSIINKYDIPSKTTDTPVYKYRYGVLQDEYSYPLKRVPIDNTTKYEYEKPAEIQYPYDYTQDYPTPYDDTSSYEGSYPEKGYGDWTYDDTYTDPGIYNVTYGGDTYDSPPYDPPPTDEPPYDPPSDDYTETDTESGIFKLGDDYDVSAWQPILHDNRGNKFIGGNFKTKSHAVKEGMYLTDISKFSKFTLKKNKIHPSEMMNPHPYRQSFKFKKLGRNTFSEKRYYRFDNKHERAKQPFNILPFIYPKKG